jgi:branched-chain amino acid transport system permease protein
VFEEIGLGIVVDKSVFPAMLFWTVGMEVMIMCLLGGMFTFMGPMLGAALIVVLRTFISSYTVYLGLSLGTILILVILFLPDGVLGYVNKRSQKASEMAEG